MPFHAPALTAADEQVIAEIEEFRRSLRYSLRETRRWKGQLRRNLRARAIRGSNSIEGYDVSLDDAIALLEDEEPLDADRRTSLEIIGYRNALTYVQQLAADPDFSLDESLLRGLHFMMLGHDLDKSPGTYRKASIYVYDDDRGDTVYEGPAAELVPKLMAELVADFPTTSDLPVFVRAAMAHLNLVMIHPFRDGNGRMARALQTLVLARERILTPEFSSIEEWLGRNTGTYYEVLAEVGAGRWSPDRDTTPWLRFNLTAHHMQAQTVLRRIDEAGRMWTEIDGLTATERLPDRVGFALYDALLGLRVRRVSYETETGLEPGTAARDLRMLVAADLLRPIGETRGRVYLATDRLRAIRDRIARTRTRPVEPYPA
jgi:Fic family protein